MNAVGLPNQPTGRLIPHGAQSWSPRVWEALTVTVIAVSVTTWIHFRKRSSDSSVSVWGRNLIVEILLQVVILSGAMLTSYWDTANLELFRVKGLDHPIVALVGEGAVLNCSVMFCPQGRGLGVEWRNLRSQAVVLTCDDQGGPCQSSRNGTHLLGDQLEDGNVSIRLEGVQASDAGMYQCTVFSGAHSSYVRMDLNVVALGTKPTLSAEQFNETSFLYTCRTEGWFPEPALIWKNSEGKNLLPLSKVTKTTGEEGLYRLEIQHWTAQVVPPSVTCIIHNRVNNIKKVSTACTRELLPHTQFYVGKTEWRLIHSFSVTLRLDTDSADLQLGLSGHLTSMAVGSLPPLDPGLLYSLQLSPCALSSHAISSDRAYWEVEVGRSQEWHLGLLGQRDDDEAWGEGSTWVWTLSRLNETVYWVTGSPGRTLVLDDEPAVVGLHLNHLRGYLSFFDARRQLHLCTVAVDSTKRLHPIFCTHSPTAQAHGNTGSDRDI
ncbi:butyrophilin subfamily 1 member A1-like [Hypanus sabinus]|uniref:butyrophilin subfamily 1 member A1-like n=1 Tax=Hypanus sabinus TaxID=79690 RepID=UPI0028C49F3C|nr:butyrophilin subfamily 1 member A1-like [Hypanus sabinus]